MNTIALRPWELAAYMREKKLLVVRPVKPQPVRQPFQLSGDASGAWYTENLARNRKTVFDQKWKCPFGKPGEVLGIKEACTISEPYEDVLPDTYSIYYLADGVQHEGRPVIPASRMPPWAIRHRPTIADIRVIEIADMRPADVVAAGFPFGSDGDLFKAMWHKHYPTLSWGWGIFLEGT